MKHTSVVGLARLLATAEARSFFRSHNLGQHLVTAVDQLVNPKLSAVSKGSAIGNTYGGRSQSLGAGASSASAAAAGAGGGGSWDLHLAFGLATLVYVLLLDGTRPNLDLIATPVIHMLLRMIAHGNAELLSLDPLLRALVTSGGKSSGSAASVVGGDSANSAKLGNLARQPSMPASTSSGVSTGTIAGNGNGLIDLLQPYVGGPAPASNAGAGAAPPAAVATKQSKPAASAAAASGGAFDFDDDSPATSAPVPISKHSSKSLGSGASAATASSRSVAAPGGAHQASHLPLHSHQQPHYPHIPGRLRPPTTAQGRVLPQDLALYLLHRCTNLAADEHEPDVSAGNNGSKTDGSSASSFSSASTSVESHDGGGGTRGKSASNRTAGFAQLQQQAQAQQQPEQTAAAMEATERALAQHMSLARDAVRSACNGKGLHVLAAVTTDAARSSREMAASVSPSSSASSASSAAAQSGLPNPAAIAHLAKSNPQLAACASLGIAPRYVLPLMRLRLCLTVLEEVSFLSGDNTAALAQCTSIASVLVRSADESSPTSSSKAAGVPVVAERCSLVSVLLCIVDWSLVFLEGRGYNFVASNDSDGGGSAAAAGSSRAVGSGSGAGSSGNSSGRAGKQAGAGAASAPSSSAAALSSSQQFAFAAHINGEHPVMDALQGALRVLINLTNHYMPGCRAVDIAHNAAPLPSTAPTSSAAASAFPSTSAAAPSAPSTLAMRQGILHFSPDAWGLGAVIRVAAAFGSHAKHPAGASPARKRKEQEKDGNTGSSASTNSADSSKASLAASRQNIAHFDALVLALGLLANCLEHDAGARQALMRMSVDSSACSLADASLLPHLSPSSSASGTAAASADDAAVVPVLSFFSSLFVSRFQKLDLHPKDHQMQQQQQQAQSLSGGNGDPTPTTASLPASSNGSGQRMAQDGHDNDDDGATDPTANGKSAPTSPAGLGMDGTGAAPNAAQQQRKPALAHSAPAADGASSVAAAGGNEVTFDADDVVVASYLALLLGCAIRDRAEAQSVVLRAVGCLLLASDHSGGYGYPDLTATTPATVSAGGTLVAVPSHVRTAATSSISLAMRALVALQNATGVLNEETLQHVQAVQDLLDAIDNGTAGAIAATGTASGSQYALDAGTDSDDDTDDTAHPTPVTASNIAANSRSAARSAPAAALSVRSAPASSIAHSSHRDQPQGGGGGTGVSIAAASSISNGWNDLSISGSGTGAAAADGNLGSSVGTGPASAATAAASDAAGAGAKPRSVYGASSWRQKSKSMPALPASSTAASAPAATSSAPAASASSSKAGPPNATDEAVASQRGGSLGGGKRGRSATSSAASSAAASEAEDADSDHATAARPSKRIQPPMIPHASSVSAASAAAMPVAAALPSRSLGSASWASDDENDRDSDGSRSPEPLQIRSTVAASAAAARSSVASSAGAGAGARPSGITNGAASAASASSSAAAADSGAASVTSTSSSSALNRRSASMPVPKVYGGAASSVSAAGGAVGGSRASGVGGSAYASAASSRLAGSSSAASGRALAQVHLSPPSSQGSGGTSVGLSPARGSLPPHMAASSSASLRSAGAGGSPQGRSSSIGSPSNSLSRGPSPLRPGPPGATSASRYGAGGSGAAVTSLAQSGSLAGVLGGGSSRAKSMATVAGMVNRAAASSDGGISGGAGADTLNGRSSSSSSVSERGHPVPQVSSSASAAAASSNHAGTGQSLPRAAAVEGAGDKPAAVRGNTQLAFASSQGSDFDFDA